MGWFSALMERRLIRKGASLAIFVLIVGAIAGGVALGTTSTCTSPPAGTTLAGSAFEIDSNANLKVDTNGCIDWLTGSNASDPFRAGVDWRLDSPSGSNDESFTQGTKEDTADPVTEFGSIPPNKSDLKAFGTYQEAGTVSQTNPTGKFLELFWARVQDPSGTTNMDFELNKNYCDPAAPTASTCSANNLTPKRSEGDILITYDLSRGGTRATISVRKWTAAGVWGAPTVIAQSEALGTINTSLISTSPIVTPQTPTGSLDPRTFGEAAIPFSALFAGNTCGSFGSAYLKSRSSDSFTAALKDFVPPRQVSISNCSSLTTNATQSVTIGSAISDTATLSGVGATAGGTITFNVYGPNDANCSGTSKYSTTIPVSGPGNYSSDPTPNSDPSDDFVPATVGTYRWTADYSGDANNLAAHSACNAANESSVVTAASPNINTTPDPSSGTVGVTLNDSAALTNGVNPQGSIQFKLFAPGDTNCDGPAVFTQTVSVNGNGTYNTTGGYQSNATGIYRWTATYTSSNANNNNASSGCQAEQVTISPASPNIVTQATASVTIDSPISDTATLSGGVNPTGTITFNLYGPNDADCSGNPVYTDTVQVNNGNGNYPSGNFTPQAVGTYRWTAHYSGDSNNQAADSPCNAEHESSVVNKAPANIATAQELFPQDSATLSASAGGTPSGTVHFALYASADCSGTPVYEETVTLANGTANTDNTNFSVKQADSGTYKWLVTYGGDNTHEGATSACGKEAFTATVDNDTTT